MLLSEVPSAVQSCECHSADQLHVDLLLDSTQQAMHFAMPEPMQNPSRLGSEAMLHRRSLDPHHDIM